MKQRAIENPIVKDKVTFVRTSDDTGGELTEIVVELSPFGGNEPHYHTLVTESFTAVEGQLGVLEGKQRRLLRPGQTSTVPPGMIHCFFNPSDRVVTFRGEARPGRPSGERFIEIAYGLARDGQVNRKGLPDRLPHVALLMEMGDIRMPGITFRVLAPVLHWIARRARKRGVEQELIRRYCT